MEGLPEGQEEQAPHQAPPPWGANHPSFGNKWGLTPWRARWAIGNQDPLLQGPVHYASWPKAQHRGSSLTSTWVIQERDLLTNFRAQAWKAGICRAFSGSRSACFPVTGETSQAHPSAIPCVSPRAQATDRV